MAIKIGDPVAVAWKGATRYGVVVGQEYGDSLPTDARFIPVHLYDDDTTNNVDSRLVTPAAGRLIARGAVSRGMAVECPRSTPGAHTATVIHADPVGTDPSGPRIAVSLTCGHTVNMSDGHGLYLAVAGA